MGSPGAPKESTSGATRLTEAGQAELRGSSSSFSGWRRINERRRDDLRYDEGGNTGGWRARERWPRLDGGRRVSLDLAGRRRRARGNGGWERAHADIL